MKYFLHDCNAFNDDKISELFIHFGYEGLGLFYTILERIGAQEKPIKTSVLKSQLKVGKRLEKCWSFMEEIGIISSKNGETFNERILSYSETYQIKKEKNREKVSQWREKHEVKNNVTSYVPVSNPPKVNKSKVKESKVNVFNTMPLPENCGECPEQTAKDCVEIYQVMNYQKISIDQVVALWPVFLRQNATGKKYYANIEAVHSHFTNWIKTQKFKEGQPETKRKSSIPESENKW